MSHRSSMSHKSPNSHQIETDVEHVRVCHTSAAIYKINPLNAGLKGITLYLIDKVESVNYDSRYCFTQRMTISEVKKLVSFE